jgi:hypothetical protein
MNYTKKLRRKIKKTVNENMAGKYTPLEQHLRALPSTQREVTLSFAQVETILGSTLPASAYEDERWWMHATEGNHVNKRAWANAGWQVRDVDVKSKRVRLVRK